MNVRTAGILDDGKLAAIILKTTENLPHSFVLRCTVDRWKAWHVVSHSHVTVDGQFYRVAVLAPFEASSSGPRHFAWRALPVSGEVLEVQTMEAFLESRQ